MQREHRRSTSKPHDRGARDSEWWRLQCDWKTDRAGSAPAQKHLGHVTWLALSAPTRTEREAQGAAGRCGGARVTSHHRAPLTATETRAANIPALCPPPHAALCRRCGAHGCVRTESSPRPAQPRWQPGQGGAQISRTRRVVTFQTRLTRARGSCVASSSPPQGRAGTFL